MNISCKHVMVVDDDDSIRECMKDVLEYEGYDVYSARNGQDALDQLNALPLGELPGCIFLDLMMPVMDGVTFLEKVEEKNQIRLANIPVLVTSANLQGYPPCSLQHAVNKLDKPLDIDVIFDAVHQYCGSPTLH